MQAEQCYPLCHHHVVSLVLVPFLRMLHGGLRPTNLVVESVPFHGVMEISIGNGN